MTNRIEQASFAARMSALRSEREAVKLRNRHKRVMRYLRVIESALQRAGEATSTEARIADFWLAWGLLQSIRRFAQGMKLRPTKHITAMLRRYLRLLAETEDGEAALSSHGTGIASIVTLKGGIWREELHTVN